ncbi:Doubled CXXCH motif (Paired_CXXCH_1) [Planctomycetes bacterium Poly30]|uniref:Doubled CXXCH motif (Paired_CXXCH_1) n=1 Tax=Saltatorellus ferox TaxID=2528018 RepID=A0A518EMB8_9BACT|nr:Doubled CXXCH motif (Paired_CXXCH_1) [Planctomycetes bacterium Poly30]
MPLPDAPLATALGTLVAFGALFGLTCLLPSQPRLGWRALGALLAVSLLAGFWFGTETPESFRAPPTPAGRVLEVPTDAYVTSNECRSCHPGQYSSWQDSYHSTMTQPVEPGTVLARFDGDLTIRGERFAMERVGDEYWGTFPIEAPDAGGERTKRVRFTQVTGSHHIQVFWYSYGDQRGLGMFPLYYHLDEERWIPWSSVFLMQPVHAPREDVGRWNVHCVKCHTTDARAKVMENTPAAIAAAETVVGEFGISCEACHGPGDLHASLNRNPLRRYQQHLSDAADDSVVNPKRLEAKASAHVCAQCHSVNALVPKRLADAQENGSPYRPGADLEETHIVFGGRRERGTQELARSTPGFMREHFWPDGMVRIGGREFNGLQRSPCFAHGDAERGIMDCTSCHSAHRASSDPRTREEWADDMLAQERQSNASCVQCHEAYGDETELARHTHHGAASSGSQCVNCHMPHTTWGLMKATRSHEIDSPSVATELATGRPNACSLCHLDRSLGWVEDRLVEWYGAAPVALDSDARDLAAGVRLGLSGDAGQRALIAWAMTWEPALAASEHDWMPGILAEFLADPYDATRFNAMRALRLQPGYEAIKTDFLTTAETASALREGVLETWRANQALHQNGRVSIPQTLFERLLAARDHTPIMLTE